MAKIAAVQKNGQGQKVQSQAEQREIERLAYQFFVERGYQHGNDQEDWLRAEAIVRKRRG